jgi:hypothetical protein
MFKDNPKLMAAGAFLAGGILVGEIALGTAVVHGAGTTTGGTGQSSAQYTAKHAWAQATPQSGQSIPLSVPSGQRLTITGFVTGGSQVDCTVTSTVNGTNVAYLIDANPDGITEAASGFQPVYADSAGSITCPSNSAPATFVGYLTPTAT